MKTDVILFVSEKTSRKQANVLVKQSLLLTMIKHHLEGGKRTRKISLANQFIRNTTSLKTMINHMPKCELRVIF